MTFDAQPFPNVTPTTDPNSSARALLNSTLAAYGLESLGEFAWQEYLSGIPVEQIMLDIRQTPEYKTRFPAMQNLAQRGRAMSEAEYVQYEKTAASIMRGAGLPPGFYDTPDDFDQFLTNDIALPELESRVKIAQNAVYNSDPATLAALEQYYGVNGRGESMMGDLTAYFLDETRALPLIQNQFVAAQTSGAAARTGYGALTRTEAERLALLGIDPQAAEKGFGTLANMQELFTQLPGEIGAAPTREQGQAAIFEGSTSGTQAIERQGARRKATFGQRGQYSRSDQGQSGVG